MGGGARMRFWCEKTGRIEGGRYEIIGSFCSFVVVLCLWLVGKIGWWFLGVWCWWCWWCGVLVLVWVCFGLGLFLVWWCVGVVGGES